MKSILKFRLASRFLLIVLLISSISCNKEDEASLNEKVKTIDYYTESFAPFNFEMDGQLRGISADLLAAIFDKMGISASDISIQIGEWTAVYDQVLNTENSMLFSTVKTDDREDLFKWVGPIGSHREIIIAKADNDISIENSGDLASYTFGVVQGYSSKELLTTEGVSESNIVEVEDTETLYGKLFSDEIDCMVYSEFGHKLSAVSLGYDVDQFEEEFELQVNEFYYAFNAATENNIIEYFQDKLDDLKEEKSLDGSSVYEKILSDYDIIQSYDDGITEDMVINLVNTTSDAIALDAPGTFTKINNGEAPYQSTEVPALYAFVYDMDVNIVAHASNSSLVGHNYSGKPDVAGKMFRDEIINGAEENGTGWVDYIYTRPDQSGLFQKTTYYKYTQGSDGLYYVVCAGKYK